MRAIHWAGLIVGLSAAACSAVGCGGRAAPGNSTASTARDSSGSNAGQAGAAEGAKPPAQAADPAGKNIEINRWLAAKAADLPAPDYRVGPPDRLLIVAPKIKELNGSGGVVQPDGKLHLNLVGEVEVANLTPAEISEKLVEAVSRFYTAESLDISVRVVEYRSKVYYVMGQVVAPGIKPYTGRDTLLRVLAEAKLNGYAWPQKVIIIRPNDDPGVKQRVTVDVKEMYLNGDVTHNYLIEEGDLVYVPLSPLSQFNVTFGRLLFPVRPVSSLALMGAGL